MPAFMTLEEYAKGEGVSPLTKATAEIFADTSDVLRALPFDTVTGGAYRYQLENTLPGIAFRGVNESFTRDTSVENPQVESLFTAGGEAEIEIAQCAADCDMADVQRSGGKRIGFVVEHGDGMACLQRPGSQGFR